MKALRILSIVLKDTIMSREKEYVISAIKEIEDFKNRSCLGCTFFKPEKENLGFCDTLDAPIDGLVSSNFSCIRWESK